MEKIIVSVSATVVAPIVAVLKKLRCVAGNPTASFKEKHKELNDGLERLLALQRDTDNEVLSDMQKDTNNVYPLWTKHVSNIRNEVASLNDKYEEARGKKWHLCKKRRFEKGIKKALNEVIKLVKECPKKILVPRPVIMEIVPSIEEYPTLKKALQDILTLLQRKGVKCVALQGQQGVGKTIIMQHLNNFFYDSVDQLFDMVIFIKVTPDKQTEDLHILQKIADRIEVDREGDESEVAGRIQKVLEKKRYLLILEGVRHTLPDEIWEKLDISNDKKDSKVVITTHYPLALKSKCVDRKVELQPLFPTEAWKMFQHITGHNHLPSTSKPHMMQGVLRLMRIRDFLHLLLSYPMRIGYEEILKQWINDVYQLRFADGDADSLRRMVEHLLSESPLRYVQVVIPRDITKDIINGGTETPPKHVPQPILLLAAHLALHQLNLTLTSDDNIQNIWFSTRNDAEKQTVVENIQANSQIRAAFDHLQIFDLNQIDDQTKRELVLLNLEIRLEHTTSAMSLAKDDYALVANNYRRGRHLVLVVDGGGDKKLDPQKTSLPIRRYSADVVVFITTLPSIDYLINSVDLIINTEDHLLPWEVFCKNVGGELLHSSTAIQRIAERIVEKCRGHLLAIILMAKSLQDVIDVQIWKLALKKLRYHNRDAIVNAFFNIIWRNVISKREKILLIRCLKVFKFQDLMMTDDHLFARWFSQQLVDTDKGAKSILQSFMQCSILLQFEDTISRYILLPQDIKIILYTLGQDIPKILSEGALVSTISNLQFPNLSNTSAPNFDVIISLLPEIKGLNLEGCMVEALPKALSKLHKLKTLSVEHCAHLETLPQQIWELQKLETLSLEHCWQLLELPQQISKLQNLIELRLVGCNQLERLPPLPNLETLSLEECSNLVKLTPQITKLHNLRKLRLVRCTPLETLPPLQNLETLSLEHCSHLVKLPPQITKLQNLKMLSLVECRRLVTLPKEIWPLRSLETLSLKDCSQLLELPPQITRLQNLKKLSLAGCTRLKTLPQEIWKLKKLQTLSLASTSISLKSYNQELIISDYLPLSSSIYHQNSGRGKKGIPFSSSAIIRIGFTLKLKVQGGYKQLEQLCQKIMQLYIQNIEMCDLSSTQIRHLPQFINFPDLRSLLLGNNLNLMKIPSSFFDHVPLLSILDLSRTSIHELPSSIFNLKMLREFYLKDCELFVELSPEISRLRNLKTLDLDGTLITHLPKQIQKLSNLESLCLSFYHDSSFAVIPPGVLSTLTHLEVLRISVNSDNEWWFKNIEHILHEINGLKMLRELDMYIPIVNFLNPIERYVSNFRFIIGHHKPRMVSCVLPAIEVMFKESSPSLKYVNGQVFPDQVKSILSKASAFFLDRHMTINNLAQFGLKNLKQLRLCILAECNEMQSILDMDEYEADPDLDESFCMQLLTIFYMKNLRTIINRPILSNTMFCELKLLALHTCPELTTIFTMHFLNSLVNLEELIVEDCPKVRNIISCPSSKRTTDLFLPRLRKLSLLFVPELSSISNGVFIGRNLEQMGFYYCPKLQSLLLAELSSQKLKVIRGEWEWWKALKWSEAEWGQEDPPFKFNQIFSPIDEDLDILTQLTTYELTSFIRENDSGIISRKRVMQPTSPTLYLEKKS